MVQKLGDLGALAPRFDAEGFESETPKVSCG